MKLKLYLLNSLFVVTFFLNSQGMENDDFQEHAHLLKSKKDEAAAELQTAEELAYERQLIDRAYNGSTEAFKSLDPLKISNIRDKALQDLKYVWLLIRNEELNDRGPKDNLYFQEVIDNVKELANEGQADAQYILGLMYDRDQGVEGTYMEAFKWFKMSADQGYPMAQHNLGWVYNNYDKNPTKAIEWYKKAAEQGYAISQNFLGRIYEHGQAVERDDKEAVKWYKKAAEQGYDDAQHNLGWMYVKGRGVAQNYSEAVKWFRMSADQGHIAAQNNLGWMHDNRRDDEQSDADVKLCLKALEKREAYAENKLKSLLTYQLVEPLFIAQYVDFNQIHILKTQLDNMEYPCRRYLLFSFPGASLKKRMLQADHLHPVFRSLFECISAGKEIITILETAPIGLFITFLQPTKERTRTSLLNSVLTDLSAYEYEGEFYLNWGEEAVTFSHKIMDMIKDDGAIDKALKLLKEQNQSVRNKLAMDNFMEKVQHMPSIVAFKSMKVDEISEILADFKNYIKSFIIGNAHARNTVLMEALKS